MPLPHPLRLVFLAATATLLCAAGGCSWYDSLRGNGFADWNNGLGANVRGNDPSVQPSGFFTDKRSDQIEKNLGGGF
jgi:hypothetical protein